MKQCNLFLFVLILISFDSFSQTQKGSILARGAMTLHFDNVKVEVDGDSEDAGSRSMLELNPSVGYFIMDGIAVGAAIDLQREVRKNTDQDKTIYHSFSIGPFARYYSALGPFFQLQFSVGGGANKNKPETGPESKDKFGLRALNFGLGYPMFFSESVALEPIIMYRALTLSSENPAGEDVKTKYRGLMMQIGFTYYIF